MNFHTCIICLGSIFLFFNTCVAANTYPWLNKYTTAQSISKRILPPHGYTRITVETNSFAYWLRHLPLKKSGVAVMLHTGAKKLNQTAHYAVIDIDTGSRNLQQCADAVIRLRAEYLFSQNKGNDIHFNFTSGDTAYYKKWVTGYRPEVKGNKVKWVQKSAKDTSYANFKKYLTSVFTYAGTHSLERELKKRDITDMQIGDVFIQGGFPGHAIIVTDMAVNPKSGKKVFMLAQGYMPAQDLHILKDPDNQRISPWYELNSASAVHTPEWTFKHTNLKYFK